MDLWIAIILIVAALVAGAAIGALIAYKKGVSAGVEQRKHEAETMVGSAEQQAARIVEDAEKDADNKKKSALIEAKDEIHKLRTEADKEIKDRRAELSRQERRMQQKEENLDKKTDNLEKKEDTLNQKIKSADEKLKEAESIKKSQMDILERISEFTKDQAKEYILSTLEDDLVHEKAVKVQAYEQLLKDECNEKARSYISLAIAKVAADQVSEAAVSVVPLPNDEMKGRIIGREGRNIRTLETLTGVDLIIDDTPEAITLSCFDQIRREVARIALEKLIADGRIHPTRIEEMVDKARREVEHRIKQEGERAVIETNVHGLNHELIKLLGRLKYRTSYRQNVLDHSIEVAQLCGVLASELGVDANMARRAGLLHDIGKALTSEIEGSHVQIGVDVCKKLTTTTLSPEQSSPASFRLPTLFPLQDLPQEARTMRAISSVSRSSRRYAPPMRALISALQFRQAARSGSWSFPRSSTTRRWYSLRDRLLSRSRPKWITLVRSRSTSFARAEFPTTQSKRSAADGIRPQLFLSIRKLCI